ncbi:MULTISPECIES: 3-ketoacyl-ACP reductase [Mesorhizobium]|uniref:3-ketoacyl-ACP reductase n=1 Tax=Mesorhizobium denitrificans TaxID=2294114 RepID=A0A371XC02_9HYPH|nr:MULTISPECIES: 3-ketoacyl-ACP reductase [Mesorhizobium]RFC66766.1 3-ketoacyl-ACP reductase [Mesorhizobium denitrificans]
MSRPVAFVTGASRGIGLACAEVLAQHGFDLFVADLADHPSAELTHRMEEAGASMLYRQADISDLDGHEALAATCADRLGPIACLVNNAGIGAPVRGDLLGLLPENFDKVMNINLRGTVFLTLAVARQMLAQPADHARSIITITSVSAEMASPERSDYCISKAALSMWVKNLAIRLAPENVGVFEVRPGIIRTDMTAGAAAKYDRLIAEGFVPASRWGEAVDIGAAVAALATGKLGFATGSVLNLDGALSVPRL